MQMLVNALKRSPALPYRSSQNTCVGTIFSNHFTYSNHLYVCNSHCNRWLSTSRRAHSDSSSRNNSNIRSMKKSIFKRVRDKKEFYPIPFTRGQVIEIDIEDVTNEGNGVGRYSLSPDQKWVIMVPLVITGERVKVSINHNHKSFSEAALVEIITPSPHRVVPQCKHYSECNGCQYQHISMEYQHVLKKKQVQYLLTRIAENSDMSIKVNDVIRTSKDFHYRTKLFPRLRRTKSNKYVIGFHDRNDSRNLVDIKECLLATESINEKYKEVRDMYLNEDGSVLNEDVTEADLLFRDGGINGTAVVTSRNDFVEYTVGNIVFRSKAGDFFQINPSGVDALLSVVLQYSNGYDYLIDTYCGGGLFGICLAKNFDYVVGVEIERSNVVSAAENAKRNNVDNIEFLCASAEEIFDRIEVVKDKKYVVLIDPPRAGVDDLFLMQMKALSPDRLIYISCEPSTQMRDVKKIVRFGYTIISIQPVDMFPNTRHIENVIVFDKSSHNNVVMQ